MTVAYQSWHDCVHSTLVAHAKSAFHPSMVDKPVRASTGKAQAGMLYSARE